MIPQEPKGSHIPLSQFPTTLKSEVAIWREAEWGDMRVGFETYLTDFDDAELLKGLPDDRCQCPHWGYVLAGRLVARYRDHHDVIHAGEVYYMAPGHTMTMDAGTVLIEFSPREQFRELTAIAEKNLARLSSGHRAR
jgi:hypothetical protein